MPGRLLDRRQKIIDKRFEKLAEVNEKILELGSKAITDQQAKIGGKLGILELVRTNFSYDRNKLLKMDSKDRLKYAKMWFENADNMRRTIIDDKSYEGLLDQIDKQLEIYRERLNAIDRELAEEKDAEKRRELLEEKKELFKEEPFRAED